MSDKQNASVKMWAVFNSDGLMATPLKFSSQAAKDTAENWYRLSWDSLRKDGYTCRHVYLYDTLPVQQPEADEELLPMTDSENEAYEWLVNRRYPSISASYARIIVGYITRLRARLAAGNTEGGEDVKKETVPIPINAARRIADDYGYDQIVIMARKVGKGGLEHVTTYGINKAHCNVAAKMGYMLKYKIMGWTERNMDKSESTLPPGETEKENDDE